MELGKTQYCYVDILPPLRSEDEGVAYADDTCWFSAGLQAAWMYAEFGMVWDVLLVASDLYLQSDEKLLPPTSGFRILGGCDMSLVSIPLARISLNRATMSP